MKTEDNRLQNQWCNDRPCYPRYAGGGTLGGGGGGGGGKLTNFLRYGSKMHHISANLAFGRREKIFGGTKSSRGRQKRYII